MLRLFTQAIKVALIGLTAIAIISGTFWFFDFYQSRSAQEGLGSTYVFAVRSTDDSDSVAERLDDAGLINSQLYFKVRMRLAGGDLAPGTYRLVVGMSAADIVTAITSEESTAQTENPTLSVTIPEGWRIRQIADALGAAGLNGGAEAFLAGVQRFDTSGYDFLDGIDTTNNPDALEGFLFPDTYSFKADTPPEDLVQLMLDNFDSKFTETMRQQAADAGLTVREVLIYASLVEREASISEERPIIADIYLSRIQQGWRLDADPTIQYVLGTSEDWWPKLTGDDLTVESPYNTYRTDQLPPGPICNPGIDSIISVLNPADTDYMFFVAKGDTGEHAFAVTLEEQTANIERYQGATGP